MAVSKWVMMKSFLLLFVSVVLVFGNEHVPVLVWEAKGSVSRQIPDLPSLSKLSSEEFSDFFIKKLSGEAGPQPLIAVFVEENLSVEDFSWQDAEGHIGFPHLENLTSAAKRVEFFPSVHAPLKGLKRLGYRWQTLQVEDQENDLSLPSEGGVVLIVKLGDARIDEDRPEFLKRHDYVISEIYNDLVAKSKDVIALYTSRHSSLVEPAYEPLVRRVRSAPDLDENAIIWNDTDIIFYTTVTPVFIPNTKDPTKFINISKPMCNRDVRAASKSLKCKFDNNNYRLEFRFTTVNKYWYLNIYITDMGSNGTLLSTDTEIYAPEGFSYHCSQNVTFKNDTVLLILRNFQIQPDSKGTFDDAYDCVWFFTVPIWSGLLVTTILVIILMMGLVALMDINTMDRFDDPKGKPININVSE
ncbi:hypothetical protein R5R35_005149 [Gryllus longicercus]|uniref:Vacuolar ATP synthase subunit S1 n=1 Tax=Gryllus longicercus TaxID=2509291 RepID=A0AAN9V9I2_9ORTH